MSLLNTGLNALGTVSALKSLFGKPKQPGVNKQTEFQAALRQRSVARTNLFDVTITLPPVINEPRYRPLGAQLSLWAEGAQLPGYNIQTDSIKRFGIGPMESVPYSIQTNDLTLNFIGDGAGGIQKFFYSWMHAIVRGDEDVRTDDVSASGLQPYEVEFKNRYATTITITQYDEQGTAIIIYDLTDAFPKNIPDVSVSWTDNDSFMQFGVTFSYLQAKMRNASQGRQAIESKNGLGNLSALQKAIKVGTALQTLKTIRRPSSVQDALASASTIKNVTGAFPR
jgi:hypothetical protein